MRIVIIEAGPAYTERVGTFTANLTGIKSEMVEQAKTLVTKRGYRVMPGPEAAESEGGCCEHVSVSDGTEYIAITVYPGGDWLASLLPEGAIEEARRNRNIKR